MNKHLICTTPGQFEYGEEAMPVLQSGHAILRIRRVGVCGTDLHAYEGTQPYFSYPRILGHELAGELVDFDEAPGFEKGELVTFIPYVNCGHCFACRTGKPNCCMHIKVTGVHMDGGMRQYLQVPLRLLLKGQGLGADELALVEPLAIGAHGIRRGGVAPGDFVLVAGAGPIGLATMEFARIAGGTVIAMDVNNNRLAFCRNTVKVAHTINPLDDNAAETITQITGGDMCSVVLDATGNLKAINGALSYLAHGGRYVLIGLQKEPFSFSHPDFHKRETTLMSSRNATAEDFAHVITCMKQGLADPQTYITHRVPFGEVKDVFESWLNPATGVIKAMIEME